MRKFFESIPKVIFAIVMYVIALALGIISAYFTTMFYNAGLEDYDLLIMSGLAISLEIIKFILSVSYPFIKYRDYKIEKSILLILKICFVLSVLASMYFLMLGKDVSISPAGKTVEMLYKNIPVIDFIPLNFSQFTATISLCILIEFFIVFLPIIAPVLFKEKDYDRRKIAITNFEKLKEIPVFMINNFIDKLHKKYINENSSDDEESNVSEIEKYREKKKDKNIDKYKKENEEIEKQEDTKTKNNSISDSDKLKVLKKIFEKATIDKNNNIKSPSVNDLVKLTGLKRTEILDIKRDLETIEIIKTDKNKTYILSDSYKSALKTFKEA